MKRVLMYDCEIVKAIPSRDGQRDPHLDYCGGWDDHENMGISVVGYAFGRVVAPNYVAWERPEYVIGDHYGLGSFSGWLDDCIVCGFNSVGFDDKLMGANGASIQTDYDLLRHVRYTAYGSIDYRAQPKGFSYSLGKIAEANGYAKTGTGANAAEQWQRGEHKAVIDYCMNDVRISCELMNMGLLGELIDPNDGKQLLLKPLRNRGGE